MNDLLEKIHNENDAAFAFLSCASICHYCPRYFITIINGEEILFQKYYCQENVFASKNPSFLQPNSSFG
jgi:hypothetical protein